jgi:hypothetical protein
MNQVLLGLSFPFVLALVVYFARRCRAPFWLLAAFPGAAALSIVWAVAPDLPRLWGDHALYRRLMFDPRCDIFFWHYTIDKFESDSPLYLVGFVLVVMAVLLAVWRELRAAEGGG